MPLPKITVAPELVYADGAYADACIYIKVPGGDWKLTVSRNMATDEIYENIEYADDDECFDETDKEMPADARALFDASKPAAVALLMAVSGQVPRPLARLPSAQDRAGTHERLLTLYRYAMDYADLLHAAGNGKKEAEVLKTCSTVAVHHDLDRILKGEL